MNEYIKNLSDNDKKTLSQKVLKTGEEYGELSKKVLAYESAQGSLHNVTNKEEILEEVSDIYLSIISIAYSLGFTDEDIENSINKKANKWCNRQMLENNMQKPIPYEIHITVDLDSSNKTLEEFREICKYLNVKPLCIDLDINDDSINKDVMTSSKYLLDSNMDAVNKCSEIKNTLSSKGYKVIREKIETVPWHISNKNKHLYFESHIQVLLPHKNDKDILLEDVSQISKTNNISKIHTSSNFFKKNSDGVYVIMLTYREFNIDMEKFNNKVEIIKNNLNELNYKYEKVEVELCIYDTNIEKDDNWIK